MNILKYKVERNREDNMQGSQYFFGGTNTGVKSYRIVRISMVEEVQTNFCHPKAKISKMIPNQRFPTIKSEN